MDFFDFSNPGELVRNVRAMVRCPFCGSEYSEKNIKVVGKSGKNHVLHLLCKECSHTIMANIAYKGRMKNSPGTNQEGHQIIEAQLQEIAELPPERPINDDDVMDFFKALKDFDGDFNNIFKDNKKLIN